MNARRPTNVVRSHASHTKIWMAVNRTRKIRNSVRTNAQKLDDKSPLEPATDVRPTGHTIWNPFQHARHNGVATASINATASASWLSQAEHGTLRRTPFVKLPGQPVDQLFKPAFTQHLEPPGIQFNQIPSLSARMEVCPQRTGFPHPGNHSGSAPPVRRVAMRTES
jgi:hypothetical protein